MEDLLLARFAEHGRDLPWRRTRDSYAILVSGLSDARVSAAARDHAVGVESQAATRAAPA